MRKVTADSALDEFSNDAGMIRIRPQAAYFAESEEEVASALESAGESGTPITPRGGGTSIPSQSVGRGIILLQDRRIAVLNGDGTVSCQPAILKSELNDQMAASGLWMPVDPSSYKSCTVGGMVSNNSSGIRTPKYGSTIDHLVSVRAVLPGEGVKAIGALSLEVALGSDPKIRRVASLIVENQKEIAEERPRVTKNSSGYRLERVVHDGVFDYPKLFAGSEGTLGVLTHVVFRTSATPGGRLLFIVETGLDELSSAVSAFTELGPTAVELLDKSVFKRTGSQKSLAPYSRSESPYLLFCEFEVSGPGALRKLEEVSASRAAGLDPLVLSASSEIAKAWEVRNQTLALALEIRDGPKVLLPGVEDMVVPPERFGDLVRLLIDQFERRGLQYISYGHAADANLHARPLLDPGAISDIKVLKDLMEECFEAVWRMGGSMTGEHGDGMLRAPYLERQYPKTFGLMKEIKGIYDPKGILNPGVKIS